MEHLYREYVVSMSLFYDLGSFRLLSEFLCHFAYSVKNAEKWLKWLNSYFSSVHKKDKKDIECAGKKRNEFRGLYVLKCQP